MEPYRKRRWRLASSTDTIPLFTCARPGRSKGSTGAVPDRLIDHWVRNLPGAHTAIVSLLGRKKDGTSEWSFYSFHCKESFQEWLNKKHTQKAIEVIEHPTTDFVKISSSDLRVIAKDVDKLLAGGRTVVVVDSGGETRTRQVMKHMKFVEDTQSC